MKRKDALRKVRTICERLDLDFPNYLDTYKVTPLRMYLYGSLLTNKLEPDDVDLLLFVDDHRSEYTEAEFSELAGAVLYHRPTPVTRAIQRWRAGMKKVHLVPHEDKYPEVTNADQYFSFFRLPGVPNRLIWQPGLDWQRVLADVEHNPRPWNPALEAQNKAAWIDRTLS